MPRPGSGVPGQKADRAASVEAGDRPGRLVAPAQAWLDERLGRSDVRDRVFAEMLAAAGRRDLDR